MKISFLAFLCGGGEHCISKVGRLCQETVTSDRPRWKGRLWLYTAATDCFQVWKQEMWFNQNFSAWLQRGYDELFKAESFLSKIKSVLSFYVSFAPLGFYFSFYPAKLSLEVVSVYQWWLILSTCVCVCVCARVHAFQHKMKGMWLRKSILHKNLHNCCDFFMWCLGFQNPLLGSCIKSE